MHPTLKPRSPTACVSVFESRLEKLGSLTSDRYRDFVQILGYELRYFTDLREDPLHIRRPSGVQSPPVKGAQNAGYDLVYYRASHSSS